MAYTDNSAGIHRQTDVLRLMNEACLANGPRLTVILDDGRRVSGFYYGARISVSGQGKLSCFVELGDETGDYCGSVDALDIVEVA